VIEAEVIGRYGRQKGRGIREIVAAAFNGGDMFNKRKEVQFKGKIQHINIVDVRPYFWDMITYLQLSLMDIHNTFTEPSSNCRGKLSEVLLSTPLQVYLSLLT
jgi:hypothetical protein